MRIYTATEKTTGRAWYYTQRIRSGRREFSTPYTPYAWAKSLREAREFAQQTKQFRYNDEPALVVISR